MQRVKAVTAVTILAVCFCAFFASNGTGVLYLNVLIGTILCGWLVFAWYVFARFNIYLVVSTLGSICVLVVAAYVSIYMGTYDQSSALVAVIGLLGPFSVSIFWLRETLQTTT